MISVIISFNALVMHVTKIIFFFAKLDMLITTIGVITIACWVPHLEKKSY